MARQQRLLDALVSAPAPPNTQQPLDPQARLARLAIEQGAVAEAFEMLAGGDLAAAETRIGPLVEGALDPRTLTTLARIRAIQGKFGQAFEYLGRAEQLDPADQKVLQVTADLLRQRGRHGEELLYRRRAAYARAEGSTDAYVKLAIAITKSIPASARPPLQELQIVLARIKAAEDMTPEHRMELAKSIFQIDSIRDDARAMYQSVDPPEERDVDVLARWTTLPAWCTAHGVPLYRLVELGATGRRPALAALNDAIVHPGFQWMPLLDEGRCVLSNFAARRISLRSEDPASPLLLADMQSALVRLPREMHTIDQPVLLVGGVGHYFHDLVEHVPGLALAETLNVAADLPLLVPETLPRHMREMLKLLGVADERLASVPPDASVRCRNAYLPTRLVAGRWVDPLLPAWYRRRLAHLLAAADAPRRKLYLSSHADPHGAVQNEIELAAALTTSGFEVVHCDRLSVEEQVRLFSQAGEVVSVSGSALTNLLFAPAGTRVVILQNRQLALGSGDHPFEGLAQACGHIVTTVQCSPVRLVAGQHSAEADLVVDVAQLMRDLGDLTPAPPLSGSSS